jgi:hypothetical protein
MAYRTVQLVLASAVATGGTFTVGYPTGTDKGTFSRGTRNRMTALQNEYTSPTDMTVSLGASSATVTYNGSTTLPAGTTVYFELDAGGPSTYRDSVDARGNYPRVEGLNPVLLSLGAPITADADGIITSASITSASPVTTMTGALAVSGAVTLDVPRNIVAAWTNTAVMTVTGFDEYEQPMVENSASGTSMTGVKAFKRVTRIAVSANVTGCTVGTGDVLGLPVRLPGTTAAHILKELQDGAAASAGTPVGGLTPGTKSTATTADVRGTYDPNAACDGSRVFALIVAVPDARDLGNPQFAG